MYKDGRLRMRHFPKEAAVSQIFINLEQLPLTINWRVSRSLGHSSSQCGIVLGCWEQPQKVSLMVSETDRRPWTDEQGAAAVVVGDERPQGNTE
jgi:hypothetical protein